MTKEVSNTKICFIKAVRTRALELCILSPPQKKKILIGLNIV